jgi:hypothetical protein
LFSFKRRKSPWFSIEKEITKNAPSSGHMRKERVPE